MSTPGVVDIGKFADSNIKFVGVRLDEKARLVGIRLSDLSQISETERPLIVAVIRDEKLIIPGGTDRLKADDLIYFISEEEKLLTTLAVFDKHSEPVRRTLIIGGGRIGLRVA